MDRLAIPHWRSEGAAGGWWVSVYGEGLLDKARASDKESKEITNSIALNNRSSEGTLSEMT
jgi:hypothetical protein